MRIINPADFAVIGHNLRLFQSPPSKDANLDRNVSKGDMGAVVDHLHDILRSTDSLGLNVTKVKTSRVIASYEEQPPTIRQLATDSADILERLTDELNANLFLAVDARHASLYTDPLNGWGSVIGSFQEVAFDIEEAGKCLALNRGTACVSHLMRVVEVGLYALATDLGVQNVKLNWQNAIDQIEKAVREMDKSRPGKSASKKDKTDWAKRKQFASEGATHFVHVKDAWRNRVAHSGQVYTDEHADRIYNNVIAFMQHLATRLGDQE